MTSRRIGSWEVLLNRRPLSFVDLANRYDALSGSWERTAGRFQLEAAYQEPLLTSQLAMFLRQAGQQAQVLDCGLGSGSLSMALDIILTVPVTFYGVDTSAERAASEQLQIIRLVEESHLSARLTLVKLGIPRTTFYRY